MSWDDIVATGNGFTEYRLEIEGYDYGFVTHKALAGNYGLELAPPYASQNWRPFSNVTVTSGQTDPVGGTLGFEIAEYAGGSFTDGADLQEGSDTARFRYKPGERVDCELYLKKDSDAPNFCECRIAFGPGSDAGFVINPRNGAHQTRFGSFLETNVESAGEWWKVTFSHEGLAGNDDVTLRVVPSIGRNENYPTIDAGATGSVVVAFASIKEANSGVEYLNGLKREGLQIDQQADIINGMLDAQSMRFEVVDLSEKATEVFARVPGFNARLETPLGRTSSSVSLSTYSGLETGSMLYLGREAIRVGGINESGNEINDIKRAQFRSIDARHAVNTEYGGKIRPLVTDIPLRLSNRRLWLYGYGNDLEGTGSLIWRGITHFKDGEPTLSDGGSWIFTGYPLTELFEQDLGGEFGEMNVRGLDFGDEPSPYWYVRIYERSDHTITAQNWISQNNNDIVVSASGFYNTAEEFLTMLNEQVREKAAALSGDPWSDHMPEFLFLDNGCLAMKYKSSPTYYPKIAFTLNPGSEYRQSVRQNIGGRNYTIFGPVIDPLRFDPDETRQYEIGLTTARPSVEDINDDNRITEVEPNKVYVQPVMNTAPFPSALGFGGRLYVDAPDIPETANSFVLTDTESEQSWTLKNVTINGSNRYIDFQYVNPSYRLDRFIYLNESHTVTIGVKIAEDGSIIDFFRELANLSADYAGEGLMPLISEDEFDFDQIQAELDAAGLQPFQLNRDYMFYKPVPLKDIISNELKLLGMFPIILRDGRIGIKRFRLPSITDAGDAISHNEILTDTSFPIYKRRELNIKNVAELSIDYNPSEEEWKRKISVAWLQGLSEGDGRQVWEIKPYSRTDEAIGLDEIENVLVRPLIIFGVPMASVEFDVPFTRFNVQLGDPITLTSLQTPNAETARRGITDLVGVVIGKKMDLDTGRGTLKILTNERKYRGYTPSAEIITGSLLGDATYRIHLTGSRYAPGETLDGSYFEIGWDVETLEQDHWGPNIPRATGSITAVDSTGLNIVVDVDFAPAPPAALVNTNFSGAILRFTELDRTQVDNDQKRFAWISSGSVGGGYIVEDKSSYFGP